MIFINPTCHRPLNRWLWTPPPVDSATRRRRHPWTPPPVDAATLEAATRPGGMLLALKNSVGSSEGVALLATKRQQLHTS